MGFYFTPPTYEQSFLPEREGRNNLMRFYTYPTSKTVLITGTDVTEHTAPETALVAAADAVFWTGGEYEVTTEQKDLLEGAGYTVEER